MKIPRYPKWMINREDLKGITTNPIVNSHFESLEIQPRVELISHDDVHDNS